MLFEVTSISVLPGTNSSSTWYFLEKFSPESSDCQIPPPPLPEKSLVDETQRVLSVGLISKSIGWIGLVELSI